MDPDEREARQTKETSKRDFSGGVEGRRTGECSAIQHSAVPEVTRRIFTHFSTRQTVRRTAHEEASKQGRGNRSHNPVIQAFFQHACGAVCCIARERARRETGGQLYRLTCNKAVRRLGRALGLRHYSRQM